MTTYVEVMQKHAGLPLRPHRCAECCMRVFCTSQNNLAGWDYNPHFKDGKTETLGLSLCPNNFNYLRRRLRREKTAGDFRSFVVLNPKLSSLSLQAQGPVVRLSRFPCFSRLFEEDVVIPVHFHSEAHQSICSSHIG